MTRAQQIDPFNPTTWDEDAKTYFGIIDKACAEKKDALLSNGQPAHAVYIIRKFLENARQSVRLFTGQLLCALEDVPVYQNMHIIKAARTFLGKSGTTLSVILEKEIDVPLGGQLQDHPLIQAVAAAKEKGEIQGSLKVYQALEEHLNILRETNFAYHWMVMDEQAYRLEKDTEKATAFVNFGDTDRAARLSSFFDSIAIRSTLLREI